MPPINQYKCSHCDFSMSSGWGGCMYVINEQGERITCSHPVENSIIMEVLGISREDIINEYLETLSPFQRFKKKITQSYPIFLEMDVLHGDGPIGKLVRKKTGFNSDCVCLNCLQIFPLDLKRDKKRCPTCKSGDICTTKELVGKICPSCHEGIFQEIDSGVIT